VGSRACEPSWPTRSIKISRYGFSDDGTVLTIPFYAIEKLLARACCRNKFCNRL
jgi:hypothetical protein